MQQMCLITTWKWGQSEKLLTSAEKTKFRSKRPLWQQRVESSNLYVFPPTKTSLNRVGDPRRSASVAGPDMTPQELEELTEARWWFKAQQCWPTSGGFWLSASPFGQTKLFHYYSHFPQHMWAELFKNNCWKKQKQRKSERRWGGAAHVHPSSTPAKIAALYSSTQGQASHWATLNRMRAYIVIMRRRSVTLGIVLVACVMWDFL